jgi:hypothetical protein
MTLTRLSLHLNLNIGASNCYGRTVLYLYGEVTGVVANTE